MQRGIEKLDLKFEPSMKLLTRILMVILKQNSLGKTHLSQESNVNYVRLTRCLDWLEKKSLVKFVIKDGKTHVQLSQQGREFTMMLSSL